MKNMEVLTMEIVAWKKDNGNGLKYYTISRTCPEPGAIKTIIDFNKKIVDCYGVPCLVSDFNRKIVRFDNKKQIITYNAPSIRLDLCTFEQYIYDNYDLLSYTDYTENGVVTCIEQKAEAQDSPAKIAYAIATDFNSVKNDPNKLIWHNIINYIKENQNDFFTKCGNWKARTHTARLRMLASIMGKENMKHE